MDITRTMDQEFTILANHIDNLRTAVPGVMPSGNGGINITYLDGHSSLTHQRDMQRRWWRSAGSMYRFFW